MLVKNISGTGDRRCFCGSWTKHWENFSGAKYFPQRCAASDCESPPAVGAHVRAASGSDQRHAIVLLCHSCNARQGAFALNHYVIPVSANVRDTCGQT